MQRLKYVFIFLCLVPGISFGQLIVDDGVSASEAVNGVLSGGGVTIENIQHSGDGNQLGVFDSELSNIGLSAGIMLSTGSIHGAIGPNSTSSHTSSGGNTGASDPDLELLTEIEMNDASVLEFDFMPAGDSVVFKYVFASEEYNEYACSDFNDAFGFFLSGPGLNGPYTNGAINIARIPNTEIPVSINSINLGEVGVFGSAEFCDNLNPNWQNNIQYFVNNEPAADLNATQYDGLTTVLTATAYVNCGESYHIKIAIADAFDDLLDSAVFLEAGSLESQGYQTDVVITPTLESLPANTIIEGCSSALVTISRPDNTLEEMLTLTVSGSASNGLDYGEIPNIVTFAAGENSVSFPINAETDTYLESPEDVVVLFAYQNSCGNAVSESIEIQILDYQPLEIDLEEEVELCPESTSILNVEPAGGIGPFQYVWNGEPGGDNISISSEADWVQLEVMDVCGAFVEQIISIETSPVLEITLDDAGCIEQAYTPLISGGLQPVEIFWTGPSQPEFGESEITFLDVGIFEITWEDACGMLSNHEIEISSCALLLPNVFTPNSDSQNDYLRIGGIEHFPGTTVQVFDRWGSIIFGSHDYRNNWDAYGISDGTYFLSLTTTSGEQHSTHLTILR